MKDMKLTPRYQKFRGLASQFISSYNIASAMSTVNVTSSVQYICWIHALGTHVCMWPKFISMSLGIC
jgi:hypothetical protein